MMPNPVEEKIAALRAAADAGQWDEFVSLVRTWADEDPTNEWVRIGVAVAQAIQGDAIDAQAKETIASLDRRLFELIELLDRLRRGEREEVRIRAAQELAWGARERALVDAYLWAAPDAEVPVRHLFSTPHLVTGCVIKQGEIAAMAAKGTRISGDALGYQTEQIYQEIAKLNGRVDLGHIYHVRVVAGDGAWVLACDETDASSRMVATLVAAPDMAEEAAARARVVLVTPEQDDA